MRAELIMPATPMMDGCCSCLKIRGGFWQSMLHSRLLLRRLLGSSLSSLLECVREREMRLLASMRELVWWEGWQATCRALLCGFFCSILKGLSSTSLLSYVHVRCEETPPAPLLIIWETGSATSYLELIKNR